MSGVDRLPLPLLLQVLSNLQIEGLSEARRVNKQWKAASDSDKVWRNLFGQYYEPQSATALVDSETRRWRNKFISLAKRFSLHSKHEGMSVVNSGLTVRASGQVKNWGTIRLDFPQMRTGVHYCEFITDEFLDHYLENTWKLVIGVITDSFEFSEEGKHIGYDDCSFGYIAQSGKKIGGQSGAGEELDYAAPFKRGERIGVLVDFNKDEISFYKDGEFLGVAFSGFSSDAKLQGRTFYFAVSMIRSGMQVSVLPNVKKPEARYSRRRSSVSIPPMLPLKDQLGGEVRSMLPPHSGAGVGIPHHFNFEECSSDVKHVIMSMLPIRDLRRVRLVSRQWKALADSDFVWKPILNTLMPDHVARGSNGEYSSWREYYMKNVLKFSKTFAAPGTETGTDGRTLSSGKDVNYWAAARLEYPQMTEGVHYCEFRIDQFRHGSIGNTWKVVLGIVTDDFEYKLTKWVGVDEKSFGYIAQNGKKVGPLCKNQGAEYAETFQEHDTVGILVDLNAWQVSFYKNGMFQGVAFEKADFEKLAQNKFYFCVSLARWGMQVTAQRYEYIGPCLESEAPFDVKCLFTTQC